MSRVSQSIGQSIDEWLPGAGEQECGVTASGCGVSFLGDENILELVVIIAKLCDFILKHWIAHIKRVNL